MKLKWLGHASFLITASNGTRIITDPYTPGGPLTYAPIGEAADIVTVSHEHGDHNNVGTVQGKPQVVKGPGSQTVKGIAIKGVPAYHDANKGVQRGQNTLFSITVDGVRIAHMGDLGHPLDDVVRAELGVVDILLTPVGGNYTIDGPTASHLADALKARVVIPMHFRNAHCAYPIADAEVFLKERKNVRRIDGSEVEFTKESLPKAAETVVLKPAL